MNSSSGGGFRWRDLSIRAKLGLVFGMQLLLVVALGLTAFFGLQSVQRQRTILLEAQRVEALASELELEFVEARAIQRNFLLGWQNLGHREAVERFVPAHTRSVEDIRQTAGEVEALLADSDLDSAPRARRDTQTLIAVADFYEGRFLETVEVLEQLAAEESGAFAEMDTRILTLQVSGSGLQVAGGDPDDRSVVEGIFTLREHQDLYRFSGDPVVLQSLRQEAGFLDQRIDTVGALGAPEGALATQQALQDYLAQVDTVEGLSDEFRDKSASLDALIDEAQPIWEEVAASAREEAAQAETNAESIGRVVNVVVAAAIATTVIVGTFVTALLWQDFSNRLAGLTQATRRLQVGDLTARADVQGGDDFGQVATAFNAMADQLEGVVTGLEAQAGARARDLETIGEVSQAIASLRSPDVLLQDVVELVRERFNFYHAQVFLIDETGRYAVLRESTGEAGRALLARGHQLAVGSQSVIGQVSATGRPVVALDTDANPVHRRNELLPDTRSEMALPLRIGDEILGALDVQSVDPNAFDENDVAVFQTMADQLAIALRNAQLFEQSQAAVSEVEALNRRMVGQTWDRFVAQRESPSAYRVEGGTILPADGLSPDVLERLGHEPLVELDAEQNGDMQVAVPIRVRGEVIGAFAFGGAELDQLSEEDLTLIEAVAERVGIALENVRLFEQTQQQARREQLVNQITSKIVGSTDVNDILQTTARELGRVLRSPKTSIQLRGEQADE